MYCSNKSSMATLLQQKGFMKNLTNGGNNVVVVTNNNDDGSQSATPLNNTASRVLLPHEMVGILPSHNNLMTHQQQQLQQQQQQQQTHSSATTTIPSFSSSINNNFNNQFINHLQSNNHLQQQQPQQLFINNHTIYPHLQPHFTNYTDVNNIFRPLTTTNNVSTTSNSMLFTTSQHHQQHHQPHSNIYENGHQHREEIHELEETDASLENTVTEDALQTNTAIDQDYENEPEIDIVINNVVCSFSVRCHLNLRDIALNGFNVEFRRENGMVTMKLRRPYTTASIWSSGKITCTGATSEDQAKIAARRYSRCLQKLGFNVRFRNFRIVNVLGTCSMPWAIKIVNFSEKYKKDASYEPELHPGVTYKLLTPKATLKIFSTGSITVTASSVAFVQAAIEHIFPLVYEFRKKRTLQEKVELSKPIVLDPVEPEFDPECDTESATITSNTKTLPQNNKAILNKQKSRYNNKSNIFNNKKQQKRPAGKADNDPNEDMMHVSDNEIFDDGSDDDLMN